MKATRATQRFPALNAESFSATSDALHGYARVLGEWMSAYRPKRKHWWHASLRPSLNGLTTDVIHAGIDFELQLNFRESALLAQTANGEQFTEALHGQSAAELAEKVRGFLNAAGLEDRSDPNGGQHDTKEFAGYSAEQAGLVTDAFNSVTVAMESFRAGIREETSPIQLWPHHFDLALLWLPGGKVAGQDAQNEEYADKQMNFGFTLGDEGISEPYFYVTAYPLPETLPEVLPNLSLPEGTTWQTEGFTGAVLLYRSLVQNADPQACLLDLWNGLLSTGREHRSSDAT
jgi:hypothetical protein